MGLSCRLFLLDHNDGLHRLPNITFDLMLRDPVSYPISRFAACRVRMTDVVVELLRRRPIRVVGSTFCILTFDQDGCFDPRAFIRRQWARAELALAPAIGKSDGATPIVEAANRFIAQGDRWTPSTKLARYIEQAALNRVKVPRL